MSCLGNTYNPVPTREWSRVQNQCTYFNPIPPSSTLFIPLLGIEVPYETAYYYTALLNKGNVLQYKNNSSQLTKKQRYSKIATAQWTNRTTTWATQSDKYTNPNTNSLKRVGNTNITLDGTTTNLPITPTCIPPIIPDNPNLPPIIGGGGNPSNPVIPPPPPPDAGGGTNIIPDVPIDGPITPIVIPNNGNLICNAIVNPCTGETMVNKANQTFYPTTDSDVPGPIQYLYWNPRIQTWYPKQRLTMSNSGNKWPYNSKFIFAA
jgi:hypothetical protein